MSSVPIDEQSRIQEHGHRHKIVQLEHTDTVALFSVILCRPERMCSSDQDCPLSKEDNVVTRNNNMCCNIFAFFPLIMRCMHQDFGRTSILHLQSHQVFPSRRFLLALKPSTLYNEACNKVTARLKNRYSESPRPSHSVNSAPEPVPSVQP